MMGRKEPSEISNIGSPLLPSEREGQWEEMVVPEPRSWDFLEARITEGVLLHGYQD